MILKVFRTVWFFSLTVVVILFMYTYAGWPDPVTLDESGMPLTLSKDGLFYIVLTVIAFANFMTFVVGRSKACSIDFKSWFYGFITCFHFFLGMTLNFISVFNSQEKFDFARLAVVIYGSLVVMGIWIVSWPIYYLFKKKVRVQE
jgi:uncharacterized membrane protein YiaA